MHRGFSSTGLLSSLTRSDTSRSSGRRRPLSETFRFSFQEPGELANPPPDFLPIHRGETELQSLSRRAPSAVARERSQLQIVLHCRLGDGLAIDPVAQPPD